MLSTLKMGAGVKVYIPLRPDIGVLQDQVVFHVPLLGHLGILDKNKNI
jgi:hypothetical protein